MKQAIKERAEQLGFDDCRFTTAQAPESGPKLRAWLDRAWHGQMDYIERNAHKRLKPQAVLPGARSIITLAVSYAQFEDQGSTQAPVPAVECSTFNVQRSTLNVQPPVTPVGIIARYARYEDYHDVLGAKLKALAEFVNRLGAPDTRSLWYVDTGPVLERDLAQRAGLGFIGKHTNVISRRLGNWIFLCEILTTLELEPDAPERNYCGSCTRCIAACPTGAIKAPFQLDARLCISYLTIELRGPIPIELRPAIGNRIFGCDDCLAVCPWNRFAREGRMMKAHARTDLTGPGLLQLLSLDDAGFKRAFAGTPILRAKRRGLLRNVCVALGNVGNQTALPAMREAASSAEPLIAEHAAWAVAEICKRQLGR